MVAKFVLEVETREGFEPARVIYTGTTAGYVRQRCHDQGAFTHVFKPVCLTGEPDVAMGYATERAKFYRDSPVVLVVDTEKLEGKLRYDGRYKAEALSIGSFVPMQLTPDEEGRFTMEDYYRLVEIEEQIVQASGDEVHQECSAFLSGAL